MYKHFSGTSPSFLSSLLEVTNSVTRMLKPTYYDTKYGRRAFRYTAPRLWNGLPQEVRTEESINTFKKNLKAYLFKHTGENQAMAKHVYDIDIYCKYCNFNSVNIHALLHHIEIL